MSIYLSLGSNEGARKSNLISTISLIKQNKFLQLVKISSIYETKPVGYEAQPWFLNAVIEIETNLEPEALLKSIKEIEKRLGREESFRWGPRIIDVDILSYDDRIMQSHQLTIPHPEMHRRKFVLIPLAEIAADYIHPISRLTIKQMLDQCPENQVVYWYDKLE